MRLPIVHHPDYDARFAANHRFPMGKYRALIDVLAERGFAGGFVEVPSPAARHWLEGVHDAVYVAQVISSTVPRGIERDIGFPVDERVSRRARLAAAGTVLAARLALAQGIALNAAGGSHHARRSQGAGFCTFNDVAVAARLLLEEGAAGRILVMDLDVHQGDGTAEIFADEARVYTVSLHGERNYPVRKIASDLDVGLPDGTGDALYLDALAAVLERLETTSRPDLVFYNAGVDPHHADRLGRMKLTDLGLGARDRAVIGHFRERGIPVCGVIGGGYSLDVRALAERHAILFETAADYC